MSGGIVQIFLNSDLRCGHDGLADQAKKHKIDVREFKPGQFVLFVNAKRDRLKLFAASGVLAYIRAPGGLEMSALRFIPEAFNGHSIDYPKALKEVVMKAFEKRKRGKLSAAK